VADRLGGRAWPWLPCSAGDVLVVEENLDEPIGDLIRRARRAAGLSQQLLAEKLNRLAGHGTVTGHEVGRWENHQRIPRPFWRQWLSAGLGIPVDQLNRAAVVAAFQRAAAGSRLSIDTHSGHESEPGQLPLAQTLGEVLTMWDQMIGRRQLLARAGPTAGAALIAASIPGALGSARGETRPETYALHAALTERYRQLDVIAGPHAVYSQALDHHRQLMSWLASTRSASEIRHLAELAADSGDLMAWLHFDLEEYATAIACYREAADAASRVDDLSLHAYLVGRISRTLSECRQHSKALDMSRTAEHIAGTSAQPAVRSWLAVTRAFVHACLGQQAECRASLDKAAELLALAAGSAEPAPGYISFYEQGHLRKWTGHSLLALAAADARFASQGRSAIDDALRDWPATAVRESAEVITASAQARIIEREIEEAARLTARAYAVAAATGSARNLRAVTELRVQLRPFRGTPAVRDLDERILTGS
jgi:transcriptional regulator with XRE-family HTH domain